MANREKRINIASLGARNFTSPLLELGRIDAQQFVPDDVWVRHEVEVSSSRPLEEELLFEKAGPRKQLFFDPKHTSAAIVTCGGLCPGLNNVIRSVLLELHHNYGVREVLGYRFGYRGLNPANGHEPVRISTDLVERIDKQGGTILGTSRGAEAAPTIVDELQRRKIDMLFCLGGDGTLRGAHSIYEEIERRGAKIAVVGIPKTVDNDVPYCWRTFGYFTALETAREVLKLAHNEAKSALNGIGLVKVMGRDAGFIAAGATLASQEVNFTLVPEVPFTLEGERGLLTALEKRIVSRGHAVIAVAEGAGQNLFESARAERDASGNPRYHDVGMFLKEKISNHFKHTGIPFDLKYIDPSYIVRSVPANSEDSILCDQFGRRAVHAAMSGRTDVMIGYAHNTFMHVPIGMVGSQHKRIDPRDELWQSVLACTGQPTRMY